MEQLHTLVLIVHVLGATLIVGSVFVSALMLSAEPVPRANATFLVRLWSVLHWAIWAQLASGLVLVAGEWESFRHSWLLLVKIILLTLDGVVGGRILGIRLAAALDKQSGDISLGATARNAWLSFILFALIAMIGVLLVEQGM